MAVASFPRCLAAILSHPPGGNKGRLDGALLHLEIPFLQSEGPKGKPLTSPGKVLSCVQKQLNKCSNEKTEPVHLKGDLSMKKTYKIDVDCANCADKMEDAANKTPGVKNAW